MAGRRNGLMPLTEFEGHWKDIRGYEGIYQVSDLGEVRRLFKAGKARLLTPYHRKMHGSQRLVVHLCVGGKTQERTVIGLVATAFLGPCPGGYIPYHVNRLQSDNRLANIRYISKETNGRMNGRNSRRRPVVKLDPSGEPVEFYSSAREAGKANHISYQAVMDRCNRRVKNPTALDGHDYRWDDDGKDLKKKTRPAAIKVIGTDENGNKKEYKSLHEAAVEVGGYAASISGAIKTGKGYKGLLWELAK